MAGKNKGGREVRKPKQPAKAKEIKLGTDPSRLERKTRLEHGGK
jgi:hypothetical protein